MFHLVFKGPTPKDLQPNLEVLTKEEQAIIMSVIEKDLELKSELVLLSNTNQQQEDCDLLKDWNNRVLNMNHPRKETPENDVRVGFLAENKLKKIMILLSVILMIIQSAA